MCSEIATHVGRPNLRGKSLVERMGDMGPLLAVGLIGARLVATFLSGAPAEDGRRTSSIYVTYVHMTAARSHRQHMIIE